MIISNNWKQILCECISSFQSETQNTFPHLWMSYNIPENSTLINFVLALQTSTCYKKHPKYRFWDNSSQLLGRAEVCKDCVKPCCCASITSVLKEIFLWMSYLYHFITSPILCSACHQILHWFAPAQVLSELSQH